LLSTGCFRNASHFGKVFSAHYGMAPRDGLRLHAAVGKAPGLPAIEMTAERKGA
jgi:hypothetical protein